MLTFTCGARQALEIGEDVEITVEEVAPGEVRLSIHAPGRRVTRLDPIPLPAGAGDLRLVHLAGRARGGKGAGGGETQRGTLARPGPQAPEEHAHA